MNKNTKYYILHTTVLQLLETLVNFNPEIRNVLESLSDIEDDKLIDMLISTLNNSLPLDLWYNNES